MADEFRLSAKLRGAIQSIVRTEITKLSPPTRVGEVQQIDPDNNICWVKFPGDEGTLRVDMTYGNQPRYARYDLNGDETGVPGDHVRVGGRSGAYYLIDVLTSSAVNQHVETTLADVAELASGPSSDGAAPTGAIVLTPIGGIGSMFFRWTEATSADPVTYHLHVNAGTPPVTDGSMEVSAGIGLTASSLRQLRDGTPVVGDGTVTYYGIVTCEDADGPGPTSNTVSGVPAQVNSTDLAVDALIANDVTGNTVVAIEAFIEALKATDFSAITITGATIQTNTVKDRGIHLDTAGLRAYPPGGGSPFLNVDPVAGLAIVAGLVKAKSLTVSDPSALPGTTLTSLGGITEIATGGGIKLTGGVTPPASAPTLDSGYDSLQFVNDGNWGTRVGLTTDGTYWYTTRVRPSDGSIVLEKWNADGTLNTSATPVSGIDISGGCVVIGTNLYYLIHYGLRGLDEWEVQHVPLGGAFPLYYPSGWTWTGNDGKRVPALGYDGTNLLIGQSRSTDNTLRISSYTLAGSFISYVQSTFSFTGSLAVVLYGTFDIGANRYIYANAGSADFHSVSASGITGTDQPGESWPSGMTAKVGAVYTGGTFKSMDQTGLLRTYTGITSTSDPNMTKWAGNTLANATYETPLSKLSQLALPRRSKLIVGTSSIIGDGTGGSPDRVKIYVGQGAAAPVRTALFKQPDPAVGATSVGYSSLLTSGTISPDPAVVTSPPAFPGGAGSQILDKTNRVVINSDGRLEEGSIKAGGTMEAAILALAKSFFKSGIKNSGVLAANTAVNIPVVFNTPFPATATVHVTAVPNITGDPSAVHVSVHTVSNTGFTLRFIRSTATAFDAYWEASIVGDP